MLFQNHHYWDSENYKQLFPTVSDSWFWLINVWFDFETTSLRARPYKCWDQTYGLEFDTLAATRRTLPNLTLGFHSKSMWEFPHWNFQHLSSDCSRCKTAKEKKKNENLSDYNKIMSLWQAVLPPCISKGNRGVTTHDVADGIINFILCHFYTLKRLDIKWTGLTQILSSTNTSYTVGVFM